MSPDLVETIARSLLGAPDAHGPEETTRLSFGEIVVNLEKGTFYDSLRDEGGDMAVLARVIKNISPEDAAAWVASIEPIESKPAPTAEEMVNRALPDLDTESRPISSEQALLGSIILHQDYFDGAFEEVTPQDMALPIHREIFSAIADGIERGDNIDIKYLVQACGGETDHEVVPGFTLTWYLVRIVSDAPPNFGDRIRDVAKHIREVADARRATIHDMEMPTTRYGAVRWKDLDLPGPEHEWLVDDVLSRCDRSIIAGPSKSGKSFLAIHASMAVARGFPFFGHKARRGGVIYQAGEGARGVKKRFRAYRKHFDVEKSLDTIVVLTKTVDLYRPSPTGDTDGLIAEINQWAGTMPVPLELVVIDTLATATAGADENNVKDMSTVLANIARISAACNVHVMLVHHMNAAGTKIRGSTSIYANVDQVIEVIRDESTKIRTATLSKQKDDEDGVKFVFKLQSIELGKRLDGKPITSCVVVGLDESEARSNAAIEKGFQLNGGEAAFYKALIKALGENGMAPPPGCAAPRGIGLVVDYKHVKEIYKRAELSEGADERKESERLKAALGRARKSLARFEVIGADNPYVWRTNKWVAGFQKPGAVLKAEHEAAERKADGQTDIEQF